MSEWIYFLHPVRPEMTIDATDHEKEVVARHYHHLVAAGESGTALVFGRTQNQGPDKTGIVVFEAEDEPAARAFMDSDPAVIAGVMTAELFPFRIAFLHGRDG